MKQILCYGDSNTWGLIPGTSERYPRGVRWTGILQEKLKGKNIRIIEEGLCGRTTIFEDTYRENRNGIKTLPLIMESYHPFDGAIFMLGTNDCKSYFKLNAYQIAKGAERCIDVLLTDIPADKILLASPIYLGADVWKKEFDPEFDQQSVATSRQLFDEYRKLAEKKNIHIIAASDYAQPSTVDQEHMTAEGHASLAGAVYHALYNFGILRE